MTADTHTPWTPGDAAADPYYQAAAVLTQFDAGTLRPVGEGPPLAEAAVEVRANLLDQCVRLQRPDGSTAWALASDVRREVLLLFPSREALVTALESNPPPADPLQPVFDAYLRGQAPALEAQTEEELRATLQVLP
jgi:hypothetical protein